MYIIYQVVKWLDMNVLIILKYNKWYLLCYFKSTFLWKNYPLSAKNCKSIQNKKQTYFDANNSWKKNSLVPYCTMIEKLLIVVVQGLSVFQ